MKEDYVREIIRRDNLTEGLVAVLSCVEPCQTYKTQGNRQTKMLDLKLQLGKCLHFYFYVLHPIYGLLHLRLQTWFPFLIHISLQRAQKKRIGAQHLLGVFAGLLQIFCDGRELFQRGFQVRSDVGGDDFWSGQVGGVFQRLVFQPEDVEVHLVTFLELIVIIGSPPPLR